MSTFVKDPTTQSNHDEIVTKHVHFSWTVDWTNHRLVGSATHTLVALKDVDQIILDSNFLEIERVSIGGKDVKHSLGEPHPILGSALQFRIPALKAGESTEATIFYSTTSESTALGWLGKEQTAGKKFEYLFSQCQPIYARTLAPLQDTSSVKLTYSANVKSVLPALLSAIRVSPPSEEVHGGKKIGVDEVEYIYNQPVAIPSYLIAIASGNVVYKPFPPLPASYGSNAKWRTGLWTEPELLDAAYYEFSADTARYVHEAETLVTPYEFGVYDLLVLPPSFPYGGMENACLTFVTPTLLAGDRSLVNVVAHEISHSWFGNNVTTADSGHFWLNEGWTRWLENNLLGVVHGPAYRDLGYIIGRKSLKEALARYENNKRYRRLVIDFEFGEDPDGAYSAVAYEKGANLLLTIERTVGGPDVFRPYAKNYVETFRGKSIRTPEWKAHLYKYFEEHGGESKTKALDTIDWNEWFYGEGDDLPVDVQYDMTLAQDAYKLADRWIASRDETDPSTLFAKTDLSGFSSNQTVVFLERLSSLDAATLLPASHITLLDNLYSLSMTHNAEIRLRFYLIALASPASQQDYLHQAAEWIVEPGLIKGRMKFCRPVMRAVHKVDKEYALKVWGANRQFFHPIARRILDSDLGYKEN